MNDIEKQIEDSFKDDSLKKEDDNIYFIIFSHNYYNFSYCLFNDK